MSDMGITAAKAYAQTINTLAQPEAQSAGNSTGAAFGDFLTNAVSTVQDSGKAAEGAINSAVMGQGDLVDVVTAVAAAEATLETVIAVRDEVIKAYQDILRMPI